MFQNRFGFAVLAVACVSAAGAGGYLASRQNDVTPASVAAASVPPSQVQRPAVSETEGIVSETPALAAAPEPPSHVSKTAPAAATTPSPRTPLPAKRAETTQRSATAAN